MITSGKKVLENLTFRGEVGGQDGVEWQGKIDPWEAQGVGGNMLQMVIRQVKKNDTRCGCNANNQQKNVNIYKAVVIKLLQL